MFNFFNKVTPIKEGEAVHIDITGTKILINNNKISVPCNIKEITAVLGEPRAQRYETKPEDMEMLMKMHPNTRVIDRVNYMWDNLGIKCYTMDGKNVHTFGIELNKGSLEYPNVPSKQFNGVLTINGQPWLPVIKSGSDEIVIQKLKMGNYSLSAEYVDIDQDMSARNEKDYTGIEVTTP